MYSPGSSFVKTFVTRGTSGSVNADSLPTAAVFRNGVIDNAVSATVTNVVTGQYKVAGTIPTGYASGDEVQVVISQVVSSIPNKQPIDLGPLQVVAPIGQYQLNITWTDINGSPVQGVDFYLDGLYGGTSNSSGVAGAAANNGSHTIVSRATNGITFNNKTVTVSGNTATTITGNASALTPPNSSTEATGWAYVYNSARVLSGAIVFNFQFISGGVIGESDSSRDQKATSQSTGLLEAPFLRKGAIYKVTRSDNGKSVMITVPTNVDRFQLQWTLGNP